MSPFSPSRAQLINRRKRDAAVERAWTDERIWATSAMELRAAIRTMPLAGVQRVAEAEPRNPRYKGGRSVVLTDTAERTRVLQAGNPNSQEG